MTEAVMNYTVDPVWTALKSFGRGVWNAAESAGKARAAAELARMGYYDEAKYLMTGNK